jgi:hypothetical protein
MERRGNVGARQGVDVARVLEVSSTTTSRLKAATYRAPCFKGKERDPSCANVLEKHQPKWFIQRRDVECRKRD